MKRMKKTIGVLALVGLMMMTMIGCGDKNQKESQMNTSAEETIQETEDETKPYFEETRADVQVEVPSEIDAMRPILNGLCKALTGGGIYDPSDAMFYWEAIYSSINGNTWVHPDISLADNGAGYMVPKAVMEEYAAAMFADVSALPELPSNMGGIQYIEEEESYMLYSAGGFVGNMSIVAIESVDETYKVTVAFQTKTGAVENYSFNLSSGGTDSFPCAVHGLAE